MTPAELEHIREDISRAVVENRHEDAPLLPELLDLLLTNLGYLATATCRCYPNGFSPETYEGPQRDCPEHGDFEYWAACLLQQCQIRAVSQIPFAEAPNDEAPHTLEHL